MVLKYNQKRRNGQRLFARIPLVLLCKEGDYIGVFNYYEILGLSYDATDEEIVAAYYNKLKTGSCLMTDKYKTAYYILSNDTRRKKYDYSIGIRKYRRVCFTKRLIKVLARIILTLLDAFFSFFWCFLLVIIIYSIAAIIYRENHFSINLLYDFIVCHDNETMLIAAIALIDVMTHYHIRRLNRRLKHYNWEVR